MVVALWTAVVILSVTVILLSVKLYLVRKSAAEIKTAFAERLTEETNTLIDISSRDKTMRRLAMEINCQLAALREQRRRFQMGDLELKQAVTNISHDLRTPLTAICGYLDLLENEEKSESVARYVAIITNRTEALQSLAEELFRYSVIVSEKDVSAVKLTINRVLEESLLSFYGMMEQKNIHPQISLTEKPVERLLNRSALFRVFENLLSNAIKYSDGDLLVTMTEDGTVIFTNTAKKLSSVDAGKLFDRFFTVETGRDSTGLGLSIAKLLTERMGGTITADYTGQTLSIVLFFPM